MGTPDLTVVCWKWSPPKGYRSYFTATAVNNLFHSVRRHYHKPHRFVCVTDDPKGIDTRVDIVPIWDPPPGIVPPHGDMNPNCYRRLWAFSEEAREVLGERFVSVDLDSVIVDDVTPVWDRDVEFMIWGETLRTTPYNGSMWMMRAGARKQVWENFNPAESPMAARKAGYYGSDQAWISLCLGPLEKRWTKKDGVFSYRLDVKTNQFQKPDGARIIFFEGKNDPWTADIQAKCPWIKEHWTL